jgi:hypothetical protein
MDKDFYRLPISQSKAKNETVPKNPHCHSERSEESHVSLFKSKNQKRDPSAFGLRMTRKGKFTKVLEHPQLRITFIMPILQFSRVSEEDMKIFTTSVMAKF